MRKVRWAAAAAGAVLLIAGCGSEGDSAQGHGGDAPSASGSAPAKAGSGGSLDVAAVKKEIEAAAMPGAVSRFTDAPNSPAANSMRRSAEGHQGADAGGEDVRGYAAMRAC